MADDVTYDRPVKATLIVRLDNGEEWEATSQDYKRFARSLRLDIYHRAEKMLREGLGIDEWHGHDGPNLVRYLVECAVMYDHSPWADEHGKPWPSDDDPEPGFKAQLRAVFGEEQTDGR